MDDNHNINSDGPPRCTIHDRLLEYYCKDDKEAICSRCYIMGDHKEHAIESFEEKNKSIIASLENGVETATVVYNKLSELDKILVTKLKSEKSMLIENIKEAFICMHRAMKQRESEMLNEADKIYCNLLSSAVEKLKNDKQKLEKALVNSRSLLENQGLIIDGEDLLTTINSAPHIPCILPESELSSGVAWDNTHMEEFIKTMRSFGTVKKDDDEQLIHLKTVEEAPETVKDIDRIFKIPFMSQNSCDTHSISSVDTGEDVIIESDTDSISTTLSSISNHSTGNREFVVPQVKGQCKQVTVTHIRSPNDFYVQLLANKKNLEKLSRTMNSWCRKKTSVQCTPDVLERGMLVLACYSEDKQWYRARVLDVDVSGDGNGDGGMKAHVMYFDFGNEEKLPVKSLRKMESRFSRYSPFCFHCSLFDIAPLHSREWENNSIQEFFRLTRNQVLLLNAIAMKGHTYEVDLICTPAEDVLDDQFSSVRDMLIFLDLAKFARPSQSIGKTYGNSASFKTVNYFKPTPLASGDLVEMTVSEAMSPSNFYIMPNGEEKLYYLNMMEDMNEVYNNDVAGLYMMHCPRKDAVCAVKGPDSKWHRGKIITKPKHSEVTVFLADRGSTLVVHYDKIKNLLSDFIKLPSQAVYCKLADVGYKDPALDDWSEDAKVWCRVDLKGAQGTVRIVRWGEQTEVVLWMGSNTSGPSVNSLLVEAELATSTGLSSIPIKTALNKMPNTTISKDIKGDGCKKIHRTQAASEKPTRQRRGSSSSSSSLTVTNSPRSSLVNSPSKSPSKKEAALLHSAPSASHAKATSKRATPSEAVTMPSVNSTPPSGETALSPKSKSFKTPTEMSSTTNMAKARKKETRLKRHKQRRGEEEEEEEEEEDKDVKEKEDFSSLAETARKRKVQEDINKAMGGNTEAGSGDSKTDGDSIYIEIIVVCYKSPTDFFIRVLEQESALLDLMKELNQEYKISEVVSEKKWNAGDFCVVRCPADKEWYRAKINSVSSANGVEVELLDYGDTFRVSQDELRPLVHDLGTRLRRAAVRCHLASLIPTGSSDRSKWSKTATEFMEIIIKSKKLYIKTEGDPCDSGLPIDIIVEEEIPETAFDPVTYTYHSLRQKMVDQGLAMFDKPRKQASVSISPPSQTEREEVVPDDTYSQTPAPGEVELPPYTIPDIHSSSEVIPTYVDFNGVIYAQRADWGAKVEYLSEELQRVYKNSPKCRRQWSLGDVCVAPFVDDGLWYRGLIEEMDSNKAKVFYVDFGNSAWLSCDQLREIYGPFAQYHVQVFHCVLEDLVPNTADGRWPVAILDVVHEMVVNCPCTMVYKGMMDNGHLKIKLYRPDGSDLSTYLMDNGYALSTADLKDRYTHSKAVGDILSRSGLCSNPDVGCVGTIFQAVATEVELPNVIYVQRTRVEETDVHDFVKASEIAAINKEINEFEEMMEAIKTMPSSGFIKLPDTGVLCLAKYHFDNNWYRALCLEKVPELDSCLVIFIDYGTSEVVSKNWLRTLPSQFWDLPSQGIRCHLNLIPPGGPNTVWRKNSLDAMVAAVNQKALSVKIVQVSPLMVELLVESEGFELNLAYEEMIQKGLAWLPMQINADALIGGESMRQRLGDVEVEEVVEDESGYVGSEVVVAEGEDGRMKGRGNDTNNSCFDVEDPVQEQYDENVLRIVKNCGGMVQDDALIDNDGGVVKENTDGMVCKEGIEGGDEDGWTTASDDDEGSAV